MEDILKGVHELETIRFAIQVIMWCVVVQTAATLARLVGKL